ncbi:MAG: xanthine dehydrogenase family protein subunit M [Congregibacter sp.]
MSLYPSFARPRSLTQAAELLDSLSSGAVIIAGGQEIMPNVNRGILQPDVYVDIGSLGELTGITVDEGTGYLSIGALTVHRELQKHPLVAANAPLLAMSAKKAGGGRQVHNRGTIAGNVVAMHPLYDINPSLLCLGAEVEILQGGDLRRVTFASLMDDTRHGLGSEAILTRVLIPPTPERAGSSYQKLKMSGGAYGSANAAAVATLDNDQIASIRLVVGAVSERLVDASEALSFAIGERWSDSLSARIRDAVTELITEPLNDQQGEGEWRAAMAGIVAARACADAVQSAGTAPEADAGVDS